MQKKRWLILSNEIIEQKKCSCCLIKTNSDVCKKTGKPVDVFILDKDCPLIEAETKEEAMQKVFDIFKKNYNEDDWDRFIDGFKNLIQTLGGENAKK